MSNNIQNLDEILECAIREKGATERMLEIDRRERVRLKQRFQYFAYGVAACVAILVFADISLSSSARKVGYSFNPTYGQMGASEITALMQEKKIDEAVAKIDEAIFIIEAEISDPASSDPEYMKQLRSDKQELELLDAVCLMRKGKYLRARIALKTLAKSGGPFASEAVKLLEEL